MQTAPTSPDPRPRILEELRTADRLVAGALSTLQYARRQQGLDLLGLPNTEGVFDTQTQRDNASAGSDLIEAEAALRRVETELKRPPSTPDVAIQHWSLATDLLGGVLDLIPLAKLGANVDTARRLQKGIRDLFATIRLSDPQLEADVEPLADWDDGPSEIATTWRYNRPAIVVIGIIAIAWLTLAIGAC